MHSWNLTMGAKGGQSGCQVHTELLANVQRTKVNGGKMGMGGVVFPSGKEHPCCTVPNTQL